MILLIIAVLKFLFFVFLTTDNNVFTVPLTCLLRKRSLKCQKIHMQRYDCITVIVNILVFMELRNFFFVVFVVALLE